jgi:transcriptional regulator with XRE-family HTH domain
MIFNAVALYQVSISQNIPLSITMKPNATTGKRIAYYRHESNIKQEELAKKVGIAQSILSDIETDKQSPTVKVLMMIAKVLCISPVQLLPETETPFYNNISESAINHHSIVNSHNTPIEIKSQLDFFQKFLETKESENQLLGEKVALLEGRLSNLDSRKRGKI